MPSMREERAGLLARAKDLAEHVKAENRNFTDQERAEIDGWLAQCDDLERRMEKALADEAQLASIADLGDAAMIPRPAAEGYGPAAGLRAGQKGYLQLNKATAATHVAAVTRARGTKALADVGTVVSNVLMLPASPAAQGRPAQGLLDVLPAQATSQTFAYLRQITRTNQAGFVAPGDLKPTSTYALERVEDHLRVVAHLSEPVDRFWLEDAPSLQTFVTDELLFGLRTALEAGIINGDGTGETPTGFAHVSGTQTQAFATEPIGTCRSALTKLQLLVGDGTAFWVLNPADWEAIETASTTAGAYVLADAGPGQGVPVDTAARRLWGQPVALSLGAPAGTGWLADTSSVSLYTDLQGIRADWFTPADDWQRNQLRARLEGRFNLAVTRPAGLVKIALTGA